MREFKLDQDIRTIWKTFPIRISGRKTSSCCNAPTLLVQSMQGGLVTRNCSECGKYETLPHDIFKTLDLWVACPECNKPMTAELVNKNYGYVCKKCDLSMKLSDLLPYWEDL